MVHVNLRNDNPIPRGANTESRKVVEMNGPLTQELGFALTRAKSLRNMGRQVREGACMQALRGCRERASSTTNVIARHGG